MRIGRIAEIPEKQRKVIAEVMAGCLIYDLLVTGAVLIFYRRLPVLLGLFVGMISTVMMLLHMAASMEKVFEQEEPVRAERIMLRAVYLRKGVFMFLYLAVLMWFPRQINPFAVIAGALGLKAGAYLRPLTGRLFQTRSGTWADKEGFDGSQNCHGT